MPGVDFEIVRTSVPMAQVLEYLRFVPVQRAGQQLRGPCPVHRSESPRRTCFSVNLATHRYRCFHCGSFGNQIDLWAAVHKKTVYEAAVDLCAKGGIDVPWIQRW